jgi:hypothetical protein
MEGNTFSAELLNHTKKRQGIREIVYLWSYTAHKWIAG